MESQHHQTVIDCISHAHAVLGLIERAYPDLDTACQLAGKELMEASELLATHKPD